MIIVQSMEISIPRNRIFINRHGFMLPVVHFAGLSGRGSFLALQNRVKEKRLKFKITAFKAPWFHLFPLPVFNVILAFPLKMGRVSALCRACSHVELHSSWASCPVPRWTSPTWQLWSKHPGRQQKNPHPFQCIFGSTDIVCQPAGSSREGDFLLPAALSGAEVLLGVSRALWGGGLGELEPTGAGTAWLPVPSDSVHYFGFSKGRKIRDTNLHTPLRRTIKRAEDILERLQMLLCPALGTAGCLQNLLHVLLAYAPVLIYSVTLMSYHRAMTAFKQNFQKSEPAAPLCHLPICLCWPLCPPYSGV